MSNYPNWNPNQQLQGGSPYPQAHNPHPQQQQQYQQQPQQQQYQQQQYPPQQPQGQPMQFPNNGPFGGNPYTQPNPNANAHLQPQQPHPQQHSPQNVHPTPHMAPNKGMVMQSQAPVRVLPAGGPANLKRPGSVVLHTDKTESGGHHSFSEGEVTAFREHINEVLANDPRIKYLIPLKTSDEFFSAASEGLLFCQYVNAIKPGAIPEKLICFKPNPNTFEKTQNHNLAIEALRSIGFPLVNIGPTDLMSGTKHLILGMTWQAIKAGLFSKLNVKDHPEMIALMNQNEDLNKFLTLTPEDSLFRWFNWHLRNAGVPRNVNNFTTDIKDGEAYLGLMSQLAPHIVSRAMLVERDPRRRAEMIINAATQLGCNKFVTRPEDILEPNPKLNLAFAANLFNKYPGIDVSKYDEMQKRALHEAEQRMREQVAREEEERRRRWEMEEQGRQQRWAQEDQMRQQEAQRHQEQMRMQQQDMQRKQQEEQARLAEQQRQVQMEQDRLRQQQEQIRMQQQQQQQQEQIRMQQQQQQQQQAEQRRRMEEEQRMRMMTQQPPPMMMTQPPMTQPMMTQQPMMMTQPMMTVVPTATSMPPPQMMGVVQTTMYNPPPPQMVVRTVTTQYQINCWCCRRSFDAPPGIVQAVCPFCRSLNKATGPSQTTTVVQQRY